MSDLAAVRPAIERAEKPDEACRDADLAMSRSSDLLEDISFAKSCKINKGGEKKVGWRYSSFNTTWRGKFLWHQLHGSGVNGPAVKYG